MPITPRRVALLASLGLALALAPAAGRAFTGDAGASTFDSAARRYPAPPVIPVSEIPVPHVEVEKPPPPKVEAPGPRFAIERFEVVGNTLLTPDELTKALGPFRGPDKTLEDVQKARDALQSRYAADGFPTVAVSLPQQTIENGRVRLEVVEARIGRVEIRNAGIHWFSDRGIRRSTPHVRPGALIRQEDLEADMIQANANPDLRVRPLLEAGKEPGSVDVALVADDRIPLHAELEVDNIHTPGSPHLRFETALSYTNLWGLGHEVTVRYQGTPELGKFSDYKIWAGTYRAPMPWDPAQTLFFYIAKSDTTNAAVGAGGISLLGKGLNLGARYLLPLPSFGWEAFHEGLTLGFDRKNVKNTVSESTANIETPIFYVPLVVGWDGGIVGQQGVVGLHLALNFNHEGWFGGDDSENFQQNRGGRSPKSNVDGNYVVTSGALQTTTRLPAILETLAAGRFVDLPTPERALAEDWTLAFVARGQISNQPLISTEQFGAGGPDTVRGYLDRELFGDGAYNSQLELRTPFWRGFLRGRLGERVQLYGFWDHADLWTIPDVTMTQTEHEQMESLGGGLRASFLDRVTAEVILGFPLSTTPSTHSGDPHVDFRIRLGL